MRTPSTTVATVLLALITPELAGCDSIGDQGATTSKEISPAAPSGRSNDDEAAIREAIYAVFDAPLNEAEARSFVCPALRGPANTAWKVADWTLTVASHSVTSKTDDTATVDTVLHDGPARVTTVSVTVRKSGAGWQICH